MIELFWAIVVIAIVYMVILASKKPKAKQPKQVIEFAIQPKIVSSFANKHYRDLKEDEYKAVYALLSIYEQYKTLSEAVGYYGVHYRLKSITKAVNELEELVKTGIIAKSDMHNSIIEQYNQSTALFKSHTSQVKDIASKAGTVNDLNHCPSCLIDIGKEVTRARNCPSCKQRIIHYRLNDADRVLINRETEEVIKALEKDILNIHIPDISKAYRCHTEILAELKERTDLVDKRIREEALAEELTISTD